ncbi:hypothetical protein TPHA_0F03500 [Tetrapisispora phaffii CBS 4417]|uniref:Damage-regulated import facilitator 1 n=1 Tax=Tetrapisispora phaffii (strain ATCC 24235 / CBS 4417 / NBRC 1672 / NRRL Y-8282 / UCD 70-5) TaxID=1071381 RepID=G8BUP4_TETPH|nr:hypothetical protein TPHA_0F03500 [Tetrapisispora phaffii CBS 4417]CCE63830.1 hypothetical protein TPHA_0F03500 [Tetrapisispora phaffii CBS 4417]
MIQFPINTTGFSPFFNKSDKQNTEHDPNNYKSKRIKLNCNSEYTQFSPQDFQAALAKNKQYNINETVNDDYLDRRRKTFTPTPAPTPAGPNYIRKVETQTKHSFANHTYINDNLSLYSETEDYMVEGYFLHNHQSNSQVSFENSESIQNSLYDISQEEQHQLQQFENMQDSMEIDFH